MAVGQLASLITSPLPVIGRPTVKTQRASLTAVLGAGRTTRRRQSAPARVGCCLSDELPSPACPPRRGVSTAGLRRFSGRHRMDRQRCLNPGGETIQRPAVKCRWCPCAGRPNRAGILLSRCAAEPGGCWTRRHFAADGTHRAMMHALVMSPPLGGSSPLAANT
jgi:hypothetical protein